MATSAQSFIIQYQFNMVSFRVGLKKNRIIEKEMNYLDGKIDFVFKLE